MVADFSARALGARQGRLNPPGASAGPPRHHAGDHVTDPSLAALVEGQVLRDAAVLIAVRDLSQATVILTRRQDHLRTHAGQVAFPGGKIDAGDDGPVGAALREAEEEIGLEPGFVRPLGLLDPYVSNTGYRIMPVVALVSAEAPLLPNADEVAEVFEVPLAFLMDPANHVLETRPWRGADRRYYAMPWQGQRIWGVTAGIIRLLHDQVFA